LQAEANVAKVKLNQAFFTKGNKVLAEPLLKRTKFLDGSLKL
jgi:hypothetical protein